ncbi:DNA-directed RNA polymerase I subunit rpa49 [Coemansia interrupta]|uniref:DNA-directed RNA polymerase I subunit rpa49 n=1 Tax=Coemansia interrupta TaxID=1126814 RepID=A0A9W8H4V6_9FUNG|nr:DNA-directed RNA polymerase I subunit rpa49 [Coemansia interrupta]
MGTKRKHGESSDKKSSKPKSKSKPAALSSSGKHSNGDISSRNSDVTISINSAKANVQPVLAKFTAAVPPLASSFATYKSIDSRKKDECIVVSETEKIEFVGQNYEDGKPLAPGSKYLIGVYDKDSDTVTFRVAPVVTVNTVIKSLKEAGGVADRDISNKVIQARNELGEAFGSKKRKAQIRAEERNKINMDFGKDAVDVIEASIGERVSSMPTKEELDDVANQNRSIPRYNAETKVAAEIFDMDDVLPKVNQMQIDTLKLTKATDAAEYKACIPVRSPFIQNKIEQILNTPKPDLVQLRRALYLSYLIRFSGLRGAQLQKRDDAIQSMCCSPEIADFIFDQFCDSLAGVINPDGSPTFVRTKVTENKLLCYVAVLILSLNSWVAYPAEMAADLGISSKQAEKYFANVGCKLEAVSSDELAKHTFGKRARAGASKKAVLVAPIKFPKASLRRN